MLAADCQERPVGAIVNLLKMLGEFLPLWAIGLIAAGLIVWLGPGWFSNIKLKQVRERVRRRVRATDEERRALLEEAMAIAADDEERLSALAREARKHVQADLYEAALTRMEEQPMLRRAAARIRAEVARPDPVIERPMAVAAVVSELLAAGQVAAARVRLEPALQAHPTDPVLRSLQTQVSSAETAAPPAPVALDSETSAP
jgi:hypothetical protein